MKEQHRRAKAAKGKFPKVRLHNRCSVCGRPKAYYRLFGLCRLHFREFASQGKLPGVLKESW
jgi:small subunit ribosomal protein S14